jgi:hypothetical protein
MRWVLDREVAWVIWELAHPSLHIRLLSHPRAPPSDTTKVRDHLVERQTAIYDHSLDLDTGEVRHRSNTASRVTVDHHPSTDTVRLRLPKAMEAHPLPATDHRLVSGVVDLRRLRDTRGLAMEIRVRRNRVVILRMDNRHMNSHHTDSNRMDSRLMDSNRMGSHRMGSRRMVVVAAAVVDTGTSEDEGKGLRDMIITGQVLAGLPQR